MTFAVIQMISQDDIAANLSRARALLEQAAAGGARLAVLPENFAAMGRRDSAAIGRAEALGEGPILPWLKQTARDLRLWIVAGTLPLPPVDQPEAKAHACSLLVDEHGELVARYSLLSDRGERINIHNRGLLLLDEEGRRLEAEGIWPVAAEHYRCTCSPQFQVAEGRLAWLREEVFIGRVTYPSEEVVRIECYRLR